MPIPGTLTNNGVAVAVGQFITLANITAGLLKFTPVLNANGLNYASFTFQVQDNGGTAGGGVDLDPSADTITVNVTAVNDRSDSDSWFGQQSVGCAELGNHVARPCRFELQPGRWNRRSAADVNLHRDQCAGRQPRKHRPGGWNHHSQCVGFVFTDPVAGYAIQDNPWRQRRTGDVRLPRSRLGRHANGGNDVLDQSLTITVTPDDVQRRWAGSCSTTSRAAVRRVTTATIWRSTRSDDLAIATDKTAYLWEDTGAATFANVSSYTKGINGIMVDITGSHPSITASDFIFRVGNNNSPGTWATIGATSVSVRAGAGVSGSDRVEIIWTSGGAFKQWLEVITLATANTGLPQAAGYPVGQADAFFFGNAVGNIGVGDSSANSLVNALDEGGIRANNALLSSNIPITNIYDVNRNASVNATDESAARLNGTNPTTTLKYLNLTTAPAAPEADGGDDQSWLQRFRRGFGPDGPGPDASLRRGAQVALEPARKHRSQQWQPGQAVPVLARHEQSAVACLAAEIRCRGRRPGSGRRVAGLAARRSEVAGSFHEPSPESPKSTTTE